MREILFKAKRRYNGEWVEGSYVKVEKLNGEGDEHYIVEYAAVGTQYLIDPNTLSQYTGRKDTKGTKIWENSVVKQSSVSPLGWHRERHSKVSFDKEGYWMLTTQYGDGYWIGDFEDEQLEVIGNIFDNPELMEIQ